MEASNPTNTHELSYVNTFHALSESAASLVAQKPLELSVERVKGIFRENVLFREDEVIEVNIEGVESLYLGLHFTSDDKDGFVLDTSGFSKFYQDSLHELPEEVLKAYSMRSDKLDPDNSCKFGDWEEQPAKDEPETSSVGTLTSTLGSVSKVWYGAAAAVALLAVLSFAYMRSR